MGSKLKKNAIMSGYINSYCLVCECYFDKLEETNDHVQEETHIDKLLLHPFLEKYGDNHIRKVNKGYFCEFCGCLLATATKVTLHIQEKSHYENKGSFLLCRPSGQSFVIAFDNVLISEKAWHSLDGETCAICNEEFDNESIHKNEPGHLLKLVQNKVEFGAENSIYRKTDETSFQCLTCNSVFVLNTLNDHFKDSVHKKLYAECQEAMKKYSEQNKAKEPPKPTKADSKDSKEKKKDAKPVDKNQNEITESSNTKTAMQEPKNDNNCKEIAPKTSEAKVPEDETTVYAKENNLTYNAGNTNAFCRICETKLPATLRSMKEHVNGKEHKNKLAKAAQISQVAKAKPQITKRPMSKFIEYYVSIANVFHQDVIINEKYCIPLDSFVMITKNGSRFRCQCCEVTMYHDDIGDHTENSRHERLMQETPVITTVPDTEFIREARTGIFHCGFCNQIIPCWEEVGSHLQSREHKDNKDACGWRFQRHLPRVIEHRRRQEVDLFRMLVMRDMLRL